MPVNLGASESRVDGIASRYPLLKHEDPVLSTPGAGYDMALGHDSLPQYVSLYSSNRPCSRRFREHPTSTKEDSRENEIKASRRGSKGDDETSVILRAMIPNKKWSNESGEWVQTVSSMEISRAELGLLNSRVSARLIAHQARSQAVCSVREEVFSELYDELVRQVTIECPERGLLLLRVRDETRMNLDTFSELYRFVRRTRTLK
ncbi:unnamed protein product [Choristocarpus tenellus]